MNVYKMLRSISNLNRRVQQLPAKKGLTVNVQPGLKKPVVRSIVKKQDNFGRVDILKTLIVSKLLSKYKSDPSRQQEILRQQNRIFVRKNLFSNS
jgi:hypothetical protein